MNPDRIKQSLEKMTAYFEANPQRAIAADKPATATIESGLRVKALGPKGESMITDMPPGIGGDNTAPTPGWFLRAALANCDATMIALRAAQLGMELTTLEVTVVSDSDSRGLISDESNIPAGPLGFQVTVRIDAKGAATGELQDLVRWAENHSPVGDALRRAVPVTVTVTVMTGEPAAS
ncbi:OsmC family protein [Noviherbaspirillum humi]|uniref:OsmC family protein n=1 Tax=Noviherbaspirillum humi TaxID=1688639 RepID=UPI001595514C|nr:OsmC family protein [Noviherbaspirillum humi]